MSLLYSFRGVCPESLQRADVIPDNLAKVVVAGKTGKDAFTVPVMQLLECQIGGKDRGSMLQMPFLNKMIKLRCCKTVGELGSKIINDQQIAMDQVIRFGADLFHVLAFAKPAFL